MLMNTSQFDTIGQYLLNRLYDYGAKHVFGVPGDYILGFYDLLVHSHVQHIGTLREDTAAFAADGYARSAGMGALAVTYGVGALNTVNAVAGAFAESSPVVVISGAPGVQELRDDPLLHHRFGPYTFQREIFERITCATAVLNDPVIAFRQIDNALAAARQFCKPVYIEIPRDMVLAQGYSIPVANIANQSSDQTALSEAVAESVELIRHSTSPLIIAGVELHRRGLQPAFLEFIEHMGYPVAATLSGKSVISELHPAYLGIYQGAMSSEYARYMVEQSDLLLMPGVTLNDVDTGIYTAKINPKNMIRAAANEVIISAHRYPQIFLADYLSELQRAIQPAESGFTPNAMAPDTFNFPEPDRNMSVTRLITRINQALSKEMIVVCDVGDCLFASIDLRVHEQSEFLASSFYTSMGFAMPAALGAQTARPDHRLIVLIGDGAFQMTGTELSTMARLAMNPIVIVFNNYGYNTERCILEGPFNDIGVWHFDRIGELFGPLAGYSAKTETEFEAALVSSLNNRNMPSIINVHLAKDDASSAMKRLAAHLRTRVTNQD